MVRGIQGLMLNASREDYRRQRVNKLLPEKLDKTRAQGHLEVFGTLASSFVNFSTCRLDFEGSLECFLPQYLQDLHGNLPASRLPRLPVRGLLSISLLWSSLTPVLRGKQPGPPPQRIDARCPTVWNRRPCEDSKCRNFKLQFDFSRFTCSGNLSGRLTYF